MTLRLLSSEPRGTPIPAASMAGQPASGGPSQGLPPAVPVAAIGGQLLPVSSVPGALVGAGSSYAPMPYDSSGCAHAMQCGTLPSGVPFFVVGTGAEMAAGGAGKRRRECAATTPKLGWSREEDMIILRAAEEHGTKWSRIAAQLEGRSDDAVRNRWNRLQQRARVQARTMLNGSLGAYGGGQ